MKLAIGGALLLVAALGVAVLSPVTLLNAAATGRFTVAQNIAYGPDPRQRLDVYVPARAQGAPVVVFFYGGSWQEGNKAMYRFVGAALAAHGVVAVIPDYRLYPQVRFPAFLQDGAAAFAWARGHAGQYGGDPARMFLMGHSAGAYIAAMLAIDPQWLAAQRLSPGDVRGLIGLAGPYDFLPLHDPALQQIFDPAGDLARTQPVNFVAPGAPPAFLAAGTADATVDPGNSRRLAARLRAAGDQVTLVMYPGIDHKKLAGALSPWLGWLAPVLRDTLDFIKERDAT